MIKTKKILFVTHDASRTGAPIVLLNLIKWLKQQVDFCYEIDILSLRKGTLSNDFAALSRHFFDLEDLLHPKLNLPYRILSKIRNRILPYSDKKNKIIKKIALQNYDLIFANTVVSLSIACEIKHYSTSKPKIINHVHELDTVIQIMAPDFAKSVKEADHFIAVSKLVKENLIDNYGILDKNISLIYEFSSVDYDKETISNFQREFLHIGAAGLVQRRKGDDIFIQVAHYIKNNYPDKKIKFTWVGYISNIDEIIIQNDLKKMGLKDYVHFVGEHKNVSTLFQDFDVFLLPSREDPFPLVAIETGLLGKPIICFEKATGIAEVIEQGGGGIIVPYLNIQEMAKQVIYYYDNREKMYEDGKLNRVQFKAFTVENMGSQILQLIHQNI